MSSYLINLSEISDRHDTFDIAYNLLEQNPVIQKVESFTAESFESSTEDQIREIVSVDFLIHVLTNGPKMSE